MKTKPANVEITETFGKLDSIDDLMGTETELFGYRIDYEIDEQRLKKLLKAGINFIPKPLVMQEFKMKEDKTKIFLRKLVPVWNRETRTVKIGFSRRGVVKRNYKVVYRGAGIVLSWKTGTKQEVKDAKGKPDRDVE